MLVDDDKDDQLIFVSAVNDINKEIECDCVDNALIGLEVLQKDKCKKPDYIFLDLNLPIMDGFQFLKEVKTSEELNDIPVIIFSTSSRDSDKQKAKELGAVDFLSKPSSYSELKESITLLLANTATH